MRQRLAHAAPKFINLRWFRLGLYQGCMGSPMLTSHCAAPLINTDFPGEKLRSIIQEAENIGNLELMASILADDITAIVPGTPVIQGKTAAVAFLGFWFDACDIQITYSEAETMVADGLATDWATYHQKTTDKKTGQVATETGRIMWVYRQYQGQWLQKLVIWNTLTASNPTA